MKYNAKDWKKKGLFFGVGKLTFEAEDAEQAKLLAALFAPFSGMTLDEGKVATLENLAMAVREKFNKQQAAKGTATP